MNTTPTDKMLATLPKWAQQHIKHLQAERDRATEAQDRALNTQTETPFYYWESIAHRCPERKQRFIQTYWVVCCKHNGVEYELGIDRDDRLRLRSNDGVLLIEMDCSNNVHIRSTASKAVVK